MNTMNTPGFSAEASLYKIGGHYQTSRQSVYTIGTINPAMDDVVEVFSCAPGLWQIGDGPIMRCIDPGDPFGESGFGGGGGGGATPGEPAGEFRPRGGRGKTPPKKTPPKKTPPKKDPRLHGCSMEQFQLKAARRCIDHIEREIMDGVSPGHYLSCDGSKMSCCKDFPGGKSCYSL
jgi:hypothetical protein